MLKKIMENLKKLHLWYGVGIALVAILGIILALTLYQSDEDGPPVLNGQEEQTGTLAPEEKDPTEDEMDWSDPTTSTSEVTEPTEPGTTEPTETEPGNTEPTETEPDSTEPTETEPDSTEPTETEPDSTEPTETEPDSTEPTETEPTVTDPMETEPDHTEPTETEPTETEPTPPKETEPQETEPTVPTDPEKPDQTGNPGIPPQPEVPAITVPEEEKLTVEKVAAFSGAYVEDGSDEPVQNVASILVTNNTDQFLDLGTLVYDIDGKEAKFIVTGLPAGASAWVMEAGRSTVTNDSTFKQKSCDTSFREDAVTVIEGVTIQSSGNMLKAENSSDQTLKNVAIYYKAVHTDGHYFGGITYMTVIGDLAPGEAVEKFAGHFRDGWANVVRIGYQTGEPTTQS